MNREIKFRVWKPEEKRWVSFPGRGLNSFEPIISPVYTDCDYFIIQQYTGLKDKSGKEIYEGDIISFREAYEIYYVPVEFLDGCFAINYWNKIKSLSELPELLVLGNIFENPELLK